MQDYLLLHKWQKILSDINEPLYSSTRKMKFSSMAKCQKSPVFIRGANGGNLVEGVGLYSNGSNARFSNLFRCRSSWACPVCSDLAAREWKLKFEAILRGQARKGYSAVMVTFTVAHYLNNPAKEVLSRLNTVWRKTMHGHWLARRFQCHSCDSEKWNFFKFARVTECNYTRNGWHFHYHVVFFGKIEELRAFWDENEAAIKERWSKFDRQMMVADGITPSKETDRTQETGVVVSRTVNGDVRVARPLSIIKYLTSGWSLSTEVSSGFGTGDKALHEGSRHVFELLASSDISDNEKFIEYATVTQNKCRIKLSYGLLDDAIFEEVEQDLFEEPDSKKKYVLVAWWLLRDWFKIIEREMRENVPHRANLAYLARSQLIDDIIFYCETFNLPIPLKDSQDGTANTFEEYQPQIEPIVEAKSKSRSIAAEIKKRQRSKYAS